MTAERIPGAWPIREPLTGAGVRITPSAFHAARSRPPSARSVHDETLKTGTAKVHEADCSAPGARQMRTALNRPAVRRAHGPARDPLHRGAAHAGHDGPARHPPREAARTGPDRSTGAAPGRPDGPALHDPRTERIADGGHHLRAHVHGAGARRLHPPTRTRAGTWTGRPPPACAPTRPRTPRPRQSGSTDGRAPTRPGRSTTPTTARSTGPSATSRPCPIATRSPQRDPRTTPTTMPRPRP
ncbi:hypothetical protein PRAC110570_13200 [Propionibacterium acidifaciens]